MCYRLYVTSAFWIWWQIRKHGNGSCPVNKLYIVRILIFNNNYINLKFGKIKVFRISKPSKALHYESRLK
jgi:hypothetical protein